jgi:hypothetical protein
MCNHPNQKHGLWRSSAGFVLCAFLIIAGLFLWLEHRVHMLGVWPLFLPLLICVGLHVFLHRGHGGHGDHSGHSPRSDRDAR